MKITHIINPFISNDINNKINNLTCETIRVAKNNIKYSDLEVNICYTCYEEDLPLMKNEDGFKKLSLLNRSILDIKSFNIPRKLPLVFDIINKADEIDYEYLIYSNIDIHLVPDFYNSVYEYIKCGYDVITINRVTVFVNDVLKTNVNELYKLVNNGEFHPGLDCFVIKKDILKQIKPLDMCIGFDYFDKYLYYSSHIISDKSIHLIKPKLTFHIGDDRDWIDEKYLDYKNHNKTLFINNGYTTDDIYCEFGDYNDDDEYAYHMKYNHPYCKNKEDRDIIKYFKDIKYYKGKVLQLGVSTEALLFKLLDCKWNAYLIENSDNFKETFEHYKIFDNIKIFKYNYNINEINDTFGYDFDIIILNTLENIDILKEISITQLLKCKLIYVSFNNTDDMYYIKNLLNIHGFNNVIKINKNNIILSK